MVTYDPASDSLPQAQGYTFENFDATAPAPQVLQGILEQGPTTAEGTQYWIRSDHPFAFAQGFVFEADLKVVSSTYSQNVGDGTQRSGFYLEAIDTCGLRLTVGFSDSGVTVNTDRELSPSNGIAFVPFHTRDGFHHYAATVQSGLIQLSIDGVPYGTTSVGDSLFPSSSHCVYFGDGSNAASSQMLIGAVRFTYQPPTAGVGDAPREPDGALRITATGGAVGEDVYFALSAGTPAAVSVAILDVAGRVVSELGTTTLGAAVGSAHWNRQDACGNPVRPGIYFAIASSRDAKAGCRIVLLR
jgi:hypothetical protein